MYEPATVISHLRRYDCCSVCAFRVDKAAYDARTALGAPAPVGRVLDDAAP